MDARARIDAKTLFAAILPLALETLPFRATAITDDFDQNTRPRIRKTESQPLADCRALHLDLTGIRYGTEIGRAPWFARESPAPRVSHPTLWCWQDSSATAR